MFERGFNAPTLSWLTPSLGSVDALATIDASPPNLREDMCGAHRKRRATEDEDEALGSNENPDSPYAIFRTLRPAKGAAASPEIVGPPVVVYTGPTRKPGDPPPVTADSKPKKPAAGTKTAATKPDDPKPEATKPAAAKTSTAKPAVKPAAPKDTAAKAAQTDTATAAKPKPKKPAAKPLDTGAVNSPQATQAR
jgi:D-alanyl-D-alanine carboxypeptidase